ncbi:MAG: U32 family peptidase [Candidatus Omnitrophota bacterium]
MKILVPVNDPKEVESIAASGADEIYCGVIPDEWMGKYTNIASPNRREWKTANLSGTEELERVVKTAGRCGVPVHLALNAIYTEGQYPMLLGQVKRALEAGVSALIVADLGFLLCLRKEAVKADIHISTGGTTFNSMTAGFYRDLGAARITLPRHLTVSEIGGITRNAPSMKFEVFILNSGCKNIDGFCTFQHGINEVLHRGLWNIPKKLNVDRWLLNCVRGLPAGLAKRLKSNVFGIDSACLLNYKVRFKDVPAGIGERLKAAILDNISSSFNLYSGIDPCGACRLAELKEAGVYGVKVVGRNYSTAKKVKDTRFLKTVLAFLEKGTPDRGSVYEYVRKTFRRIYGVKCARLCYYPDGM